MNTQVQNQSFSEETLKRLLYAVCNIGGNSSPETDEGIIYSEAALFMASKLFPAKEEIRTHLFNAGYGRTQEQREEFDPFKVPLDMSIVKDGLIKTIELWMECMQAENPVEHAEAEIAKGLNGLRVE